jgi:glycosyltransferase involved in cell wall biosynthesis
MSGAPTLCWIVINSVPYHEARLRAAAVGSGFHLRMIQLAGLDEFKPLQQPKAKQPYGQKILFPDRAWNAIEGREMSRRLHASLSELDPALVCINGWSYGGGIAALRWCLSHRVPAIVMSESTANDEPRLWWKEAIKRRVVGLCSTALVGGAPHRDYLRALGKSPDRIFDGYDVVDNDHFREGAKAARQSERQNRDRLGLPQRYFIACSRFTPKKNLGGLLQGYALYRQEAGPAAWSLVIVGEGELRDPLVALRDRLGLDSAVLFAGPKSYQELPTYYGLASAFVHASTTEQWGLVVNEAMAAGLPVLVSDRCGCAADLVEPGVNGFLFGPGDPRAIATAMRNIAADDCDRQAMGRASEEIIVRWSPDQFAQNLAHAAEVALAAARPVPSIADRALLWMLRTR